MRAESQENHSRAYEQPFAVTSDNIVTIIVRMICGIWRWIPN